MLSTAFYNSHLRCTRELKPKRFLQCLQTCFLSSFERPCPYNILFYCSAIIRENIADHMHACRTHVVCSGDSGCSKRSPLSGQQERHVGPAHFEAHLPRETKGPRHRCDIWAVQRQDLVARDAEEHHQPATKPKQRQMAFFVLAAGQHPLSGSTIGP